MRRTIFAALVLALLTAQGALAANVGFDLDIHVHDGAQQPAPVPLIVQEPPLFLVPPALGVAVAVGVPYDMFYLSGSYYLCRNNVWYVGTGYNGPWKGIKHDRLPPGLRKHKYEKIRYYRDEEYRHYREGRDHYRGKSFRPEKEEHGRGGGRHDNGKHKGLG
jgi:hypothetical protein